ncbi:MAG: HU family DNA-binding protein [Bacteroidales bacterium]|nr:HU family DNA-binding protein [Bacteroidales bacterium]
MNNKELTAQLSKKMGHSIPETQTLLKTTCEVLGATFAEMNSLTIQGFGTFEVKKKQERLTIHPSSGKRLLIPPKLHLVFLASKSFKEKLKGENHE